mmetsp:Transcript_31987/g.46088  ORF Transcript_31987/g.46088 Transcript_31987/m.46088 type:complete len:369 (-) Transcript_31987:2040-3146(-)
MTLFDEDSFQLHVMDCVGALLCFQRKFEKIEGYNDNVRCAKQRVFWQSLREMLTCATNEVRMNEALSTVLESFLDKMKAGDRRSWLPLHFAVSLEQTNPDDIHTIFSSNTENIKVGSDNRLINPCHLFVMSENPNLMVMHQLKMYNSLMGHSITSDGNTPLHLAARHSNSVALVKDLIQIYPHAISMTNLFGQTPLKLVSKNTTSMAPNILKTFLQADPRLIEIPNGWNVLPIHCCIRCGHNPNIVEFLSILIEANNAMVNAPDNEGLLPIHLAAQYSTVAVMKLLYEYSNNSIFEAVPGYGSVAHLAVCGQQLENLTFIHSIYPESMLMANDFENTPLGSALQSDDLNYDFIKAVYALEPTATTQWF